MQNLAALRKLESHVAIFGHCFYNEQILKITCGDRNKSFEIPEEETGCDQKWCYPR